MESHTLRGKVAAVRLYEDEGIIDIDVTGLNDDISLTMTLDLARQIEPGDLWDITFTPKVS